METTIPIIDLSNYTSGDTERKKQFIKELGETYEKVGFVAVTNHGIDQGLVDTFYKNAHAFFGMSVEDKLKYEDKELAGQEDILLSVENKPKVLTLQT